MKVHTEKKTQKEIEKIKVVKLDRDEDKLLNVIVAKIFKSRKFEYLQRKIINS